MKFLLTLVLILCVFSLHKYSVKASHYAEQDAEQIWLRIHDIVQNAENVREEKEKLLANMPPVKIGMKCIWSFCIKPGVKHTDRQQQKPEVASENKILSSYVIDFWLIQAEYVIFWLVKEGYTLKIWIRYTIRWSTWFE